MLLQSKPVFPSFPVHDVFGRFFYKHPIGFLPPFFLFTSLKHAKIFILMCI